MTYRSIDDFWVAVVRQLLREGHELESRVGKVKEGCAFSGTLSHVGQTFLLNKRRRLSPAYACAEFLWYLSLSNDIEMIRAYAPQYHKFAEDGVAFGAYGYRWKNDVKGTGRNQLELLIDHLQNSLNSRQAIVTMWNANDLVHAITKDHKDLPCTLSLQFLIRQNKLHLIATMRSNDAWLGLPYDVFAFTCLQWLIAGALNVEPGTYTHQVGSMHLYEKNWTAANEALEPEHYPLKYQRLEHGWNTIKLPFWQDDIDRATLCEQEIREERYNGPLPLNEILSDAVACCAARWDDTFKKPISPTLLEALRNENKEK